MTPEILRSLKDMRSYRASLGAARVGFVPTMGALHAGHADLMRRMRAACDRLVLSIFVNPTQFGPSEDLSRYPRTFEADLEIARAQGVDAVFFPTPESMYPAGFSTYVEERSLTSPLCGAFRPGHFSGVTTVVLKLFNLVRPEVALFGLKDAQQFFVLHKMAHDLDLEVSVEGVATVREADGLALSSRNRYLTPEERAVAPHLYRALAECREAIQRGAAPSGVLAESRQELESRGFRVQYLEALGLPDFTPAARADGSQPWLIAVAAYLGSTRLIDNVIAWPERLRELGVRLHGV